MLFQLFELLFAEFMFSLKKKGKENNVNFTYVFLCINMTIFLSYSFVFCLIKFLNFILTLFVT